MVVGVVVSVVVGMARSANKYTAPDSGAALFGVELIPVVLLASLIALTASVFPSPLRDTDQPNTSKTSVLDALM